MAQRKTCTNAEKEIIDRLAHAFVIEDLAKKVMEPKYPKHAASYREHMRKQCPQFYRLLDELQLALPRVHKQMGEELARKGWDSK
ncbi:hypothetical protein [Neptunicella sp. SCSIO 80796]|uniref:hypothetical protein n=1 Tax=Neptunicella plasticusilytica TaxID=3117012 RepID=UPI003A4D48F9